MNVFSIVISVSWKLPHYGERFSINFELIIKLVINVCVMFRAQTLTKWTFIVDSSTYSLLKTSSIFETWLIEMELEAKTI